MKGMQKIKRGKSFTGVVQYALKPGAHHKSDPFVVGGNMLEHSAAELIAEFNDSASLRPDIAKPAWHNSLRLPQGESLSNEQWKKIADDYMSRMGFSDTHLRCYVIHDDEAGQHIHIIASRVDLIGGKLYLGRNENLISTRVIQELELTHGLTRTKGLSPSPTFSSANKHKKLSRNEQQKEKREGQVTPKTLLQNKIDEILTSANDILSFVEALAENGITTRANIASSGRMNGFSFEYAGIAFKASQLGKTYSWATLQEKLRYEPERDNPLLFSLKTSSVKANGTSRSIHTDTALFPVALKTEVIALTPKHESRVEVTEANEAHAPIGIELKAIGLARNKDCLMTAVVRWLLSIPYLAAFADLLKKGGQSFLHRKSSFSTINAVRSAEPDFNTSKEPSQDLVKSSYTPF